MSKELEAIKYLNDTCINFLDRTKELYCTVTFTRKRAEILRDNIAEVEQALQRLESIDNATPSKALECLEKIIDNLDDYADFEIKQEANEYIDTIKAVLQKQQELPEPFKTGVDIGVIKPKQYLKWEDLEFKENAIYKRVTLNGELYLLKTYRNFILDFDIVELEKTDGTILFHINHHNLQFFNDLHLERVEE